MTPILAKLLAEEVNTGTYLPTLLNACDSTFTLDRNPHTLSFPEGIMEAITHSDIADQQRYWLNHIQQYREHTAVFLQNTPRPIISKSVSFTTGISA